MYLTFIHVLCFCAKCPRAHDVSARLFFCFYLQLLPYIHYIDMLTIHI